MNENQFGASGFALNQNPTTYDSEDNIITGFNDIYINSAGAIVTTSGVDALMQVVKNALWLWIGEYEFDTTIGLSYAGVFNGDANNAGIFTSQIEANILNCNQYLSQAQFAAYGIKTVTDINYTANTTTRAVTISLTLNLNNGTTPTITTEQT